MLNSFHMAQLKRALQLIQGPHNSSGFTTELIKQGEYILNKLRDLPQYASLLSNYLVQNNQIYNISGNSVHSNNSKTFVLLQLLKQSPIRNQIVWWHLLQFYYACNEKLQKLTIQIITKHIHPSYQLNMYYQPFLICVADGNKWGMVFISKMLHLIQALISKIKQIAKKQNITLQWKLEHLQFISNCLFQTLNRSKNQMSNYRQTMILKIIKIVKLISQTNNLYQSNQCHNFCFLTVQKMNTFILQNENIDKMLKLISYLCWMSTNENNQYQHCKDCQLVQPLPNILQILLKNSHRKYKQYPQILQILSYYLVSFKQTKAVLNNYAQNILQQYYKYIMDVQCKKKIQIMIQELPQANQQLQQQDSHNVQIHKYLLLTECVHIKYESLQQNVVHKSNIKPIAFFAYANTCQVSQQVVNTLLVYLKSALNHQKQASNGDMIICCMRFLYRFVLNDPMYKLVQIAATLLDFRTTFKHLQDLCDILLSKAIHTILTCTSMDNEALWNFTKIWVSNLQYNYMDVRAFSYYPILLILQHVEDYHFKESVTISSKDNIDFTMLFLQIIELIQQQAKCSNMNKFVTDENSPWVDYNQIFYLMGQIYIKYLLAITKSQNKEQTKQIYNKEANIISRILSFVFKNQLFFTETAFLYVNYTIMKNDVNGIMEFIANMTTDSFWRGYDYTKINFYSCVLVGLQLNYQNYLNVSEIYNSFMHILKGFQTAQQLSQEQINKLKYEMSSFALLFDMRLPNYILDFDYNSEHKSKHKEKQQIYL